MQQTIAEMSDKISRLESVVYMYENKVNSILNSNPYLNQNLDQNSKDIIVNSVRDFQRPSRITVVASQTIFPHTQYLILTAASAVTLGATTSITDGYFNGQLLIIEGTSDSNTVTINDNTNTKMSANITLGVNDTITFVWNGTDWSEICRSNN